MLQFFSPNFTLRSESDQGEDFGDEIEMTISKMVIRMVKVVIIKIDMMVMVKIDRGMFFG